MPVCSAIGAGDTVLAGLLLGLAGGMGERQALALAVAAGAAAVTTFGTAQIARSQVEEVYRRIVAE
jgi:6-phosphofructokinase 2